MDKETNLKHWQEWASQHGTDLAATTKCRSIKTLELDAIVRRLAPHLRPNDSSVLEVGCGNGVNGFALSTLLPHFDYVGVDFSKKMIDTAKTRNRESKTSLRFATLDARELALPLTIGSSEHSEPFDAVFTNRMLINLSSAEEQLSVMRRIRGVLRPGGLFLMLENSRQSHAALNQLRNRLGLPMRPAASYNIFIDEEEVIESFRSQMTLVNQDSISGIHDLMQYAVIPAQGAGEISYDSPLMEKLTEALVFLNDKGIPSPRGLGQNILWVWQKN